jgi:hypothetical protein
MLFLAMEAYEARVKVMRKELLEPVERLNSAAWAMKMSMWVAEKRETAGGFPVDWVFRVFVSK